MNDRMADETLALCLARAFHWEREGYSWDNMTEMQEDWLKVARRARELLTPERGVPISTAGIEPEDGLQPGDIVNVRATVGKHAFLLACKPGAASQVGRALVDPSAVTFIKRPAPIEPDWTPGDVARDEHEQMHLYMPGNTPNPRRPWLRTRNTQWLSRDEIPGTLTPCDVVPRGAK